MNVPGMLFPTSTHFDFSKLQIPNGDPENEHSLTKPNVKFNMFYQGLDFIDPDLIERSLEGTGGSGGSGEIDLNQIIRGMVPLTRCITAPEPTPHRQVLHVTSPVYDAMSMEEKILTIVKMLVEKGANPSGNDEFTSPLCHAIYRGLNTVVEYLLKAGAFPGLPDGHNFEPMSVAIKVNNVKAIDLLISIGKVDPEKEIKPMINCIEKSPTKDMLFEPEKITLLETAVEEGDMDLLDVLEKYSVKPSPEKSPGLILQAINFYSNESPKETLSRLVKCGYDINYENSNGDSVLGFLILEDYELDDYLYGLDYDLINFLIDELGAKPNAKVLAKIENIKKSIAPKIALIDKIGAM